MNSDCQHWCMPYTAGIPDLVLYPASLVAGILLIIGAARAVSALTNHLKERSYWRKQKREWEADDRARLIERADAQHNALMSGDFRSAVYGSWPPAELGDPIAPQHISRATQP